MSADPIRQRFQALLEGQYQIERELGRGGMATVYLAKDLRHQRDVAIKLLQPELTTAVTAERFLREIQITAKLQHPHILTLIDSGARDGLVYYVMPHVEGESLRERLIWEKQLPVELAVHIARQVAIALQHAHDHGVVHRDIKPENILLSGGHAILADFGIARAMRESGQQTITQVGMPLGTPAYMSPEQISGQEDIDIRSDLYALGCVLFEMLAGKPPFAASTVTKIMQMHLTEPPPSVCACNTAAPDQMDEVIRRALAKDKKERFQTAAEFAEALSLIEATETLERATPGGSRRQPTPPNVPTFTARGSTPSLLKRLLVLGGGVGAIVLAGLALSQATSRTVRAPAPGEVADRPTSPFLSSIGVKPLDAIGDSGARALAAGVTEEILAQLAKIKRLKVISRTTMEAVKVKGWTSKTAADSLGIRYLLEGSVHQNGRELVITLQLIDAVSDGHVWSDSYRQALRDALMLRQTIAQKAIDALAVQVPGLQAMGSDSSSSMAEAVQALAHGLELQSSGDEGRLTEAIAAFERALRLDTSYAAAAAGLSESLLNYVALGFSGRREPYSSLAEALRWGERAVVLDPNLALGWSARGAARMATGARPELALADLDRAVALAPANGQIRVARGIALSNVGRHDEALREMAAAAALDPLNGVTRGGGLAVTALAARKYDVAIREARLAAARDPGFPGWPALEMLGVVLSGGTVSCAAEALEYLWPVAVICHRRRGEPDRADQLLAARSADSGSVYTMGFLAADAADRGDINQALRWFDKAFAISPSAFDRRFLATELFDRVRDNPAFVRGLAAIQNRVRARLPAGGSR